jgi:hypothetical protein
MGNLTDKRNQRITLELSDGSKIVFNSLEWNQEILYERIAKQGKTVIKVTKEDIL